MTTLNIIFFPCCLPLVFYISIYFWFPIAHFGMSCTKPGQHTRLRTVTALWENLRRASEVRLHYGKMWGVSLHYEKMWGEPAKSDCTMGNCEENQWSQTAIWDSVRVSQRSQTVLQESVRVRQRSQIALWESVRVSQQSQTVQWENVRDSQWSQTATMGNYEEISRRYPGKTE